MYVEELNKADEVIDEMTQTTRKHSVNDQRSDEDETVGVIEDLDDNIEKVLEKFQDSDPLERTRFVKAFIEKDKSQVLAIGHTKLDQYDKPGPILISQRSFPLVSLSHSVEKIQHHLNQRQSEPPARSFHSKE